MNVVLIDYGVGNILSIKRSIKIDKLTITDKIDAIESASHIILPGVGSFKSAVELLKKKNLYNYLKNISKKKKILGICLGMQLLFTQSNEGGFITEGLNLIKGNVKKIVTQDSKYKVPNIGWRKLEVVKNDTIIKNINDNYYYFIHSFHVDAREIGEFLIAKLNYNESQIASIVKNNNIFGCQFHPEKSSTDGVKLINNFLKT